MNRSTKHGESRFIRSFISLRLDFSSCKSFICFGTMESVMTAMAAAAAPAAVVVVVNALLQMNYIQCSGYPTIEMVGLVAII